MANEQLPEPYSTIRELHRRYLRRYEELARNPMLDANAVDRMIAPLWEETNQQLEELRKQLRARRRCTATTREGKPCRNWASPDYIGQKCESHLPDIDEW